MSTDHRRLDAFVLAEQLAIRIYAATRDFAIDERFGLRAQVRRAAVSIPTNIVEGCARDSDREYARFLEIAFGSTREVIYLLSLAARLDFLDATAASELEQLGGRVAAALAALKKSIT